VETFRNIFEAKTVIISTGGRPRITRAKNEEKYLFDKGISFCATCDAAANTDKTVMVIGSGDAAIEEGMFLTKFAKEVVVSVIHDKGKMDCNEIARDAALANPKMTFMWNTMVDSFEGEGHLDTVNLKNLKTGEIHNVKVDSCFEFIGYEPNTEIFEGKVNMSKRKYIYTNEHMEIGIPGVFACGDVREKELKQVATAVGDGAIAGVAAEKYIAETEMFENQIMQSEKIGIIYIYSAIDAPSRELLPMMQEIEASFMGQVKLNVIDQYKGKSLCDRLGCDIEPMTTFYTKNGKVMDVCGQCDKKSIITRLNKLVANPIEVVV
jgi:thioredoxin reductase (NADPH)